jgi:uncharacterized protein
MLLSRRVPPTWSETARIALWPRHSWRRSFRYARLRLERVVAVPRSLALGAAAGVFVAILPIPGLQLLAAAGLAWLVRGHRGAAAIATFAANPVTYPLIWIASYVTGATLLGTPVSNATHDLDALSDMMAQTWDLPWDLSAHTKPGAATWAAVLPVFGTLMVGALPLALLAASAAYFAVRHLLQRRTPSRLSRRIPANSNVAGLVTRSRRSSRRHNRRRARVPIKAAA